MGVFVLHRHHSGLACLRFADYSWDGGGALVTGQPIADSRYRRFGATAKRRTAELHEPATGHSFWSGGRRRPDAALEPADGAGGECSYLFAADPMAVDGALYRT